MEKSKIPSIINSDEIEGSDVVFLGLPFDRSSGLAGADEGPTVIRHMLDRQIEPFEPITRSTPTNHLRIAYQELEVLHRYADPITIAGFVDNKHYELSEIKQIPFIVGLGGDHSVSIGIFEHISKQARRQGKSLPNILQIDAHFDLRYSDADFREKPIGTYAHCCVMHRAAEMGFRIVPVGVRSYSQEELDYVREHAEQFSPFFWNRVKVGYEPPVSAVINALQSEDVYLTIDVDGIDPSHMPATGTPVQNGLSWVYTIELLQALFRNRNVIGMDITEVAPPLEIGNLTSYGAATLAYTALAFKFRDKISNSPH